VEYGKQYIYISGIKYEVLSEEAANDRRIQFTSRPTLTQEIESLAACLKDKKAAYDYFNHVLYNLKYRAIEEKKPPFEHCPCIQRKKSNPDYICTGIRCPH
jgi:hypothetical protein